MSRKLIVIVIALGLVWSSVVYVPKINAYSVVQDFITEVSTSVTGVATTSLTVKEYVLDLIARVIARELLSMATSGIIKKIQGGGRDGGPAFVQNWRNFQTDAQYRGENVFRSVLAGTKLCNYFSGDIKNLFGATQKIPASGQNLRINNFDPFSLRANCTLPSNFNLKNYQNDFAGNGGWDAWSRLLEPQNNYYGALFGSLDEATKQRALEESGDLNEALAGSGYTSIRDKTCAGKGAGAKCVFLGKVFTPGDLLGKSAASTIDQDLGWLVSSDEISEVIISLVTALTNRLMNLATSDTSKDYADAPEADTNTDGYLACINACPAADDISCQTACASAWGYDSPQPSSTPPPPTSTPPPGGGGASCGPSQAFDLKPASVLSGGSVEFCWDVTSQLVGSPNAEITVTKEQTAGGSGSSNIDVGPTTATGRKTVVITGDPGDKFKFTFDFRDPGASSPIFADTGEVTISGTPVPTNCNLALGQVLDVNPKQVNSMATIRICWNVRNSPQMVEFLNSNPSATIFVGYHGVNSDGEDDSRNFNEVLNSQTGNEIFVPSNAGPGIKTIRFVLEIITNDIVRISSPIVEVKVSPTTCTTNCGPPPNDNDPIGHVSPSTVISVNAGLITGKFAASVEIGYSTSFLGYQRAFTNIFQWCPKVVTQTGALALFNSWPVGVCPTNGVTAGYVFTSSSLNDFRDPLTFTLKTPDGTRQQSFTVTFNIP